MMISPQYQCHCFHFPLVCPFQTPQHEPWPTIMKNNGKTKSRGSKIFISYFQTSTSSTFPKTFHSRPLHEYHSVCDKGTHTHTHTHTHQKETRITHKQMKHRLSAVPKGPAQAYETRIPTFLLIYQPSFPAKHLPLPHQLLAACFSKPLPNVLDPATKCWRMNPVNLAKPGETSLDLFRPFKWLRLIGCIGVMIGLDIILL